MLKIGRTEAGARAAATHTAALVGSDAVVDAIFETCGVVRVGDIDELWQTAGLLASAPLPAGDRVAVLGTSGGMNGVLADQLGLAGLTLPELSSRTEERLRALLPAYAGIGNPLDITGAALGQQGEAELYANVLRALHDDPDVDAVVAMMWGGPVVAAELDRLVDAVATFTKPVCVVCPGIDASLATLAGLERSPVGLFASPEACARALGHAARYARFLREQSPLDDDDPAGTGAVVVPGPPGDDEDAWDLLRRYGLPMAPSAEVFNAEDACAAAARLGFPVALKLDDPDVLHKTEVGGVRLDLREPAELGRAVDDLRSRHATSPFVVQPMLSGVEVLIGVHHDQQFGPVMVIGAGGTLVEVLADTAIGLPPLSPADVRRMLKGLKLSRLLEGVRGAPPADVPALTDAILAVSRLVVDLGERIESLDINPIVVRPLGEGAAVLDVAVTWR